MHCVQTETAPFVTRDGTYRIIQVPAAKDNLIWLIQYAPDRCAAVDGPSAEEALIAAKNHGLVLDTIINTHTHPDHIGINRDFKRRGLLSSMRVIGPKSRATEIPGITDAVGDNEHVELGRGKGLALLTEGHINGHTSFLFEDALFCGDALFTAGCGYLFDGPPEAMHNTLVKLSTLSEDTKVCCAHEYTLDNLKFAWMLEPSNQALRSRIQEAVQRLANGESCVPSIMKDEKDTNPFMRTDSTELRQSLSMTLDQNIQDATEADIFRLTRKLKDKGLHKSLDWPF